MIATLSRPQFSDEIVTATTLNRQPGKVLEKAAHQPITIVRNTDCFALLLREQLTVLVSEASQSSQVLEVINAAFSVLCGTPPSPETPYGWLSAFDGEEVKELVSEVLGAYRNASRVDEGWEELSAVIHEWHESAIAILSDELEVAFSDEDSEELLTVPND